MTSRELGSPVTEPPPPPAPPQGGIAPGFYVVASLAIIAIAAVIVLVPPERVEGWAPLLAALAVAVPGIIANLQNSQASKKIELVRQDVNSDKVRSLQVTEAEAFARGQNTAVSNLQSAIDTAVATALAQQRETVASVVTAVQGATDAGGDEGAGKALNAISDQGKP